MMPNPAPLSKGWRGLTRHAMPETAARKTKIDDRDGGGPG
jgi:hypothetical protein